MSEYYVAIRCGTAEEEPEYPCEPKNKVAVWHVSGPMENGYALNLLRRRVQEVGAPNVELLVKVPWVPYVAVHSDAEVKFVYPDNEDTDG